MANWDNLDSRGNVDDRRSSAPLIGGISLTTVAVVLAVNYFLGGSLTDGLQLLSEIPLEQSTPVDQDTTEFDGKDEYESFCFNGIRFCR